MNKSVKRRFWKYAQKGAEDECWEWVGGVSGNGYGRLKDNGRYEGAHRISWQIHYGEIPDDMYICHACDYLLCVNPAHLFLGTNASNQADSVSKGRAKSNVKITDQDVQKIRQRYAAGGITQQEIADEYGTAPQTISNYCVGRTRTEEEK